MNLESNKINELKLASSIKYIDELGNPVLEEIFIPETQSILIKAKLNNGEVDYSSNKAINNLADFNYYLSAVDRGYIGAQDTYDFLTNQYNIILIQKALFKHHTCSIGFSIDSCKWYGWSHRAIYGFTVGDIVSKGDLTNNSGLIKEYEIQHPEENMSLPIGFEAKTLNDAKRMAIAFACAIS